MREIKFRVWNGEKMNFLTKGNHLMLSFFSEGIPWGLYDSATEQRYVTGDPNAILNEPGSLMQYTGLIDKDGLEMCSGDIIELFPFNQRGLVVWNSDLALFEIAITFTNEPFTATIYSQQIDGRNIKRKIIGNIHENPELLK